MPLIVDIKENSAVILNGARFRLFPHFDKSKIEFIGPSQVHFNGSFSIYSSHEQIVVPFNANIQINGAGLSLQRGNRANTIKLHLLSKDARLITAQHNVDGLPEGSPAARLYKAVRAIAELPPPDMLPNNNLYRIETRYLTAVEEFAASKQDAAFLENLTRNVEQGNFYQALRSFKELVPALRGRTKPSSIPKR